MSLPRLSPLVLAAAAVLSAPVLFSAAHAASLSYAYAQTGFGNRTIGVHSASDSTTEVSASAGIGFAQISGSSGPSKDAAPSGAHNRTDFTVKGLAANAPLTFTWLIEDSRAYTGAESALGWSAFFGVTARYPFGGSYSMFGNLVVNGPFVPYTIGDPDSLLQCNGNTRGQDICGTRVDASNGLLLSVSGLASHNDTGYVEQTVNGDGYNVDFSVAARLVAVTVPDAIWFSDGSNPNVEGMLGMSFAMSAFSADSSQATLPPAYLQWSDGSFMAITVDANSPTDPPANVPLPGSSALAGLALLVLALRRRGVR